MNSSSVSAETIQVNYFEPGHTSADSFHHQVEESLKRQRKTYDFFIFETSVKSSNKGEVQIKSMQLNDFHLWKNLYSVYKNKKQKLKLYIAKITELKMKRNKYEINYKMQPQGRMKKTQFSPQ